MSIIHTQHRKEIAKQILKTVQKFQNSSIQSFILYGSTAQGTAREDSDLDIQILVDFISSPFVSFLERVKHSFEGRFNLELSLNLKTVTQFMENLERKEPLYYFILLDGSCLMNSKVFEGLQVLLKGEKGPQTQALEQVHKTGIQIRSTAILDTTGPNLVSELQSILSNFALLNRLQQEGVKQWLKSDDLMSDSEENIWENTYKDYSDTVSNILQMNQNNSFLQESSEFDLIESLKIMNSIFQNTVESHNE